VTTDLRATLLSDLARRHAAERPDAPAVIDGTTTWSWSTLDRRADAIATAIHDAGLGDGDRVGLAIGPTALGIAALHGVGRAGVSAVLVHPRLTAPEVAGLAAASACRALVVDPALTTPALDGLPQVRLGEIDRVEGRTLDPRPADAPLTEFVLPTSGTTARPKLARLPMDRIAASATAWSSFLPPASAWLLSLGLAHVAGIGIVARAAAAGVPIVVADDLEPSALLAAIRDASGHGVIVSHVSLVASQLAALLDAAADAPPPAGIAAVILGGGPIPDALVRRAVTAGWPVIPSYGMTETASGVVALPAAEAGAHGTTVGRPLPGVQLRIDDGRIAVRGPMTFAGYLDDEAATTAVIGADGWLRTGDLGRLDADGRLTVLGRSDDVIVSGGEKVAPAEIEATLLDHPAIAEVAVTGVPDPTWGAVPVAVIALRPDTIATDEDLRDHARQRLAGFKIPARFVRVHALARNDLGKVVRDDLARIAARPDPVPDPNRRTLMLADGQTIAYRDLPSVTGAATEAPVVVLLHATLSTAAQLLGLGRRLAEHARVLVIDRRGSGESTMLDPAPVPIERHAADVIELLGRLGVERAVLVGHSFGGVVALRATVRDPGRVAGLFVWEPPYLVLADPAVQAGMTAMTDEVARRYGADGPEAAARLFLESVAGDGAWDRLHPRQRATIGREGAGVLADIAMDGLTADGLEAIGCPTIVATGGASEPFYRPIAEALAARIGPGARRVDVADMRHPAPITNPDVVGALVLDLLPLPFPAHQETAP
jgi:O-succinylbenzoic acid--CoA ligase